MADWSSDALAALPPYLHHSMSLLFIFSIFFKSEKMFDRGLDLVTELVGQQSK